MYSVRSLKTGDYKFLFVKVILFTYLYAYNGSVLREKKDCRFVKKVKTQFLLIVYALSGCNKTLTGLSGTFHSPNYPQKYPDGQYCSWRITVSPAQQIHLTFTNFSLQNENNTDSLYVYDGENSTGEVLGVFYGGYPPPKNGMYSSSNNMLVIFKSDKNVSYTGFIASYTAVNCLGKCYSYHINTSDVLLQNLNLHLISCACYNQPCA